MTPSISYQGLNLAPLHELQEEQTSIRLTFLQATLLLMIKDLIETLQEIVAGIFLNIYAKIYPNLFGNSYTSKPIPDSFYINASRNWVRNLRPPNTSGQHLMKPLVEKERLDSRLQRASSYNGWNCSSGLSLSASSPSRFPRHAVPQIFTYEPKPGVFRNLNYPAFHSIRIEQVSNFCNRFLLYYVQCKIALLKIGAGQIFNPFYYFQ